MQHFLVKVQTSNEELMRIGIYKHSREILLTHGLEFRGYFHITTKGGMFYIEDEKIHDADGILWLEDRMVTKIRECK